MRKIIPDKARGVISLVIVLSIMVPMFLTLMIATNTTAPIDTDPLVYITNSASNNVSVIDTATNTVTATVDVGSLPFGIAANPDGKKVYVANYLSHNVSVIDTATNTVTATVDVGSLPFGIAANPDGKKVYVANFDSNNISVIDTSTNTVISGINAVNRPLGIAVSPDGTKIYAASLNSDYVSVIDTTTNTIIATVNVENNPFGVAVSPDGKRAYVSNSGSNTVSVINTTTDTVMSTVNVGKSPWWIVVSPDGKKVYVTNSDSNNVSVIDTATNNVVATVNVGTLPCGIAVNPQGTKVYVANSDSNSVSLIDTATNAVTATVNVGKLPVAFGQFICPKLVLPVANFSANVTSGFVPLTVQFYYSSKNAIEWKWNFGDGNTSTDENPAHTYNKTGQFTVALTASNAYGSNTVTKTSYIVASNGLNAPVANFSASPTSGKVPLRVSFTDKSSGSITSWKWTFGDGNTSTMQNPVYTYNKAGQFTVALTASNTYGSNTVTKTSYIVVPSSLNTPITNFSASPTSGKVPLRVSFTDKSSGSITSWKWTFGDGGNSTQQNPVYTYNKTGKFNVALTTSNATGSNTVTKYSCINVTSANSTVVPNPDRLVPVTAFTASSTSGTIPLTVSFTDKGTGSPTAWKWYFGDGSTSTDKNPVHVYNNTGQSSVTLTATNTNGSNALTKTSYIVVSSGLTLPVTNFSATPASGTMPLSVSFTDKSSGSIASWKWTFGDGGTSTVQNPSNIYNKTGLFSVTLSTTNAVGTNALTKTSYVAVSNGLKNPVAAFSASPTSGSSPLSVSFTDLSTGSPTAWKWTFGDGSTSTQQNPAYTYNKTGLFTVGLTVTNPGGSSTETMTGYITVK